MCKVKPGGFVCISLGTAQVCEDVFDLTTLEMA